MWVEMAFGILKGKWRLIIKSSDVDLNNMLDIVATYIVLYKLYIVNNEGIENEWIVEEANKLAKKSHYGWITSRQSTVWIKIWNYWNKNK